MATLIVRCLTICLFAFLAGGAVVPPGEPATEAQSARPRDPWVFAGSLDERPRILFVALHHDLWVAFDTQLGDIYKAWRGVLQPATQDPRAFSVWPASIAGLTYLTRTQENPWRLIRNGEVFTPEVVYGGYRITGERLTISYELITEYGNRISIEEVPEVVHTPDQRPGLQREFFIDNVPAGYQVALDVQASTLKERLDVQTNGLLQRTSAKTHTFVWGKTYDMAGRLLFKPGVATTFTTYFAPNLLKNLVENSALDPLELFKHTKVYKSLDLGDETSASSRLIRRQDHVPGVSVKVYGIGESIDSLMQLAPGQLPTSHTIEPAVDLTTKAHFGELDFYFITHVTGFLNIASEGNYSFQLLADDGVRFSIASEVLYEHNGLQAAEPSEDINVHLNPGVYPFTLEHFQSTGRKQLTLNWKPPWSNQYEVVRAPTVSTRREEQRRSSAGKKHVLRQFPDALIDLVRIDVSRLNPGIKVDALGIAGLKGSVGGMDFLSDGRVAISTWDGSGSIYIVEGLMASDTGAQAKEIAKGLAYPFGIKVIDDVIFVLQRHELTQLIDLDGDEVIDEYRVVANDWPLTNDFDEFAFGLIYQEGKFYAGLAMPVDPEGAILIEDIPDRGKLVRLGFDRAVDVIASGFQVPNGLTLDEPGMLAVIDHRNPWFSDSRLLFSQNDASFQPALANEASPLQLSSIWLPSGSKSEAPTQPLRLNEGVFAGQWIYGDLNAVQLNRVFVEEINGDLQGAVFRFTGGLAFPVNRMALAPDGTVLAGAMDFESPWKTLVSDEEILQQISFTDKSVFEMMAVRVQPDGFEIEFTQPVDLSIANNLSTYRVYQWANDESGRRKRRDRSIVNEAEVARVTVAEDGLTVKLELGELSPDAIYYFNLDPAMKSKEGEEIWSNEAWYSLNALSDVVAGEAN